MAFYFSNKFTEILSFAAIWDKQRTVELLAETEGINSR